MLISGNQLSTSLEASWHWKLKRRKSPEITDREIIFAIHRGIRTRDLRRKGVLNATVRVPSSGRWLRVVYRMTGPRRYRVITAFWLE